MSFMRWPGGRGQLDEFAAWARAESVVSKPAIIRASSTARSSSATGTTPLVVTCPSSAFTTTVPICESGDLGEVSDDDDLEVRRASRRAPSTATLPPTPASISSKTRVMASAIRREHHLQRQPDALTARHPMPLVPGCAAHCPGWRQTQIHPVGTRRAGGRRWRSRSSGGVRHRQCSELDEHQFAEPGCRLASSNTDLSGQGCQLGAQLLDPLRQGGDALVACSRWVSRTTDSAAHRNTRHTWCRTR